MPELIDVDSAFRTNFARSGHIPGDKGVSGCDPDRALSETQAVEEPSRRMQLSLRGRHGPPHPSSLALGGGCSGPAPPLLRVFSKRVVSFGVEVKPRLTNGYKRAAAAVGSGDDGPNRGLITIPAYRLSEIFQVRSSGRCHRFAFSSVVAHRYIYQ